MLLKLKVDGGTGYVYVNTEEIAAIMPGSREMDGGSVILLRASEAGVNVMESPEEIVDAINAQSGAGERAYRVPRSGTGRDGT